MKNKAHSNLKKKKEHLNRKDKEAEWKKLNKVENKESFEFVKQGVPLSEPSLYSYPNFSLYKASYFSLLLVWKLKQMIKIKLLEMQAFIYKSDLFKEIVLPK